MKAKSFIVMGLVSMMNLLHSKSNPVDNPKGFIENKGQWDEKVLYMAQMPGMNVWITKAGVTYDFFEAERLGAKFDKRRVDVNSEEACIRRGHVVHCQFVNQINNNQIRTRGANKYNFNFNFFKGNIKAIDVPVFQEIVIENVYNGVDQRWYFDKGKIRFDFIVHPGADYKQIQFKITGSNGIEIKDGNLSFLTRFGTVILSDLNVYQDDKKIFAQWEKNKDIISFNIIDKYSSDKVLIIDPIVFSTFIGGNGDDAAYAVKSDNSNNIYVVGTTSSSNYPTITGSYDINFNGKSDIFVSKLNSAGNSLIYSTFIGGDSVDVAYDLDVNNLGEVFVTGYTKSPVFPTTGGCYDNTFNGGNADVFVIRLNNSGNGLLYSTYIGGANEDVATGIKIDASNNAYITGYTYSANYPVTAGCYDNTLNSGNGIFISKINSSGNSLMASTFFEGSWGKDITIDNTGNVYVSAVSNTMFTPPPTHIFGSVAGGTYYSIIKMNNALSSLIYFDLLGAGTYISYGHSCKLNVDVSENVFFAAEGIMSFPVTPGCYDNTFNGGTDIIVLKLNNTGNNLIFATYLGGNSGDYLGDIKIDGLGNCYITGSTQSNDYPLTSNAFGNNSFNTNPFISVLNNTGSSLLYSDILFYNSGGIHYGLGLDVLSNNNIVICGKGGSSLFTTPNAYDTSFNGGTYDAFVAEFCMANISMSVSPASTSLCAGGAASFSVSANIPASYTWYGPANYFSTGNAINITTTSTLQAGTYSVFASDVNGCMMMKTPTLTVYSNPTIAVSYGSGGGSYFYNKVCENSTSLEFSFIGGNYPNGYPSFTCTAPNGSTVVSSWNISFSPLSLSMSGNYTIIAVDGVGCKDTLVTTYIPIYPKPIAQIQYTPACMNGTLHLNALPNNMLLYSWSGPNSFNSTQQQVSLTNVSTINGGNYHLTIVDTNGCYGGDTLNILINQNPIAAALSMPNPVCEGGNINLIASPNGMQSYTWTGPNNFNANQQNIIIPNVNSGMSGSYTLSVTDVNGCSDMDILNIIINPKPQPSIAISSNTFCVNQPVVMNASPNGMSGYQWYGPMGISGNQQTLTIIPNSNLYTGYYTLSVTDNNGCSNNTSIMISVYQPNTSVSQINYGGTLISNQPNALYQWYNCDSSSIIPTYTMQAFSAPYDGNFAVIINYLGCIDTSQCINVSDVYVPAISKQHEMFISPNPASDFINIVSSIPDNHIEIIDITGKVVATYNFKESNYIININNLAKGVYFVYEKNSGFRQKLIVQ